MFTSSEILKLIIKKRSLFCFGKSLACFYKELIEIVLKTYFYNMYRAEIRIQGMLTDRHCYKFVSFREREINRTPVI